MMAPPPANILLQQLDREGYLSPKSPVDPTTVGEIALRLGNYKLGIMEDTELCKKMFPQARIRRAIFFDLNIPVGSKIMEDEIYKEAQLLSPGKAELYVLCEDAGVGIAAIFHE